MKYRLLRNATARLTYGGTRFLLDPCFTPKGMGPSYAKKVRSPLVELPCSMQEAVSGVDAVVLSHIHTDHFDSVAAEALDKSLTVLCQPGDEEHELLKAFADVRHADSGDFGVVHFERVAARHGSSLIVLSAMGPGSGVVFMASGEPTVYWAGDTVLFDGVWDTVRRFLPEVIVVHAGGALWNGELIVMDAQQVVRLCKRLPETRVIAVHLEATDHGTVTREALRRAAEDAGILPAQLLIPADGEEIDIC